MHKLVSVLLIGVLMIGLLADVSASAVESALAEREAQKDKKLTFEGKVRGTGTHRNSLGQVEGEIDHYKDAQGNDVYVTNGMASSQLSSLLAARSGQSAEGVSAVFNPEAVRGQAVILSDGSFAYTNGKGEVAMPNALERSSLFGNDLGRRESVEQRLESLREMTAALVARMTGSEPPAGAGDTRFYDGGDPENLEGYASFETTPSFERMLVAPEGQAYDPEAGVLYDLSEAVVAVPAVAQALVEQPAVATVLQQEIAQGGTLVPSTTLTRYYETALGDVVSSLPSEVSLVSVRPTTDPLAPLSLSVLNLEHTSVSSSDSFYTPFTLEGTASFVPLETRIAHLDAQITALEQTGSIYAGELASLQAQRESLSFINLQADVSSEHLFAQLGGERSTAETYQATEHILTDFINDPQNARFVETGKLLLAGEKVGHAHSLEVTPDLSKLGQATVFLTNGRLTFQVALVDGIQQIIGVDKGILGGPTGSGEFVPLASVDLNKLTSNEKAFVISLLNTPEDQSRFLAAQQLALQQGNPFNPSFAQFDAGIAEQRTLLREAMVLYNDILDSNPYKGDVSLALAQTLGSLGLQNQQRTVLESVVNTENNREIASRAYLALAAWHLQPHFDSEKQNNVIDFKEAYGNIDRAEGLQSTNFAAVANARAALDRTIIRSALLANQVNRDRSYALYNANIGVNADTSNSYFENLHELLGNTFNVLWSSADLMTESIFQQSYTTTFMGQDMQLTGSQMGMIALAKVSELGIDLRSFAHLSREERVETLREKMPGKTTAFLQELAGATLIGQTNPSIALMLGEGNQRAQEQYLYTASLQLRLDPAARAQILRQATGEFQFGSGFDFGRLEIGEIEGAAKGLVGGTVNFYNALLIPGIGAAGGALSQAILQSSTLVRVAPSISGVLRGGAEAFREIALVTETGTTTTTVTQGALTRLATTHLPTFTRVGSSVGRVVGREAFEETIQTGIETGVDLFIDNVGGSLSIAATSFADTFAHRGRLNLNVQGLPAHLAATSSGTIPVFSAETISQVAGIPRDQQTGRVDLETSGLFANIGSFGGADVYASRTEEGSISANNIFMVAPDADAFNPEAGTLELQLPSSTVQAPPMEVEVEVYGIVPVDQEAVVTQVETIARQTPTQEPLSLTNGDPGVQETFAREPPVNPVADGLVAGADIRTIGVNADPTLGPVERGLSTDGGQTVGYGSVRVSESDLGRIGTVDLTITQNYQGITAERTALHRLLIDLLDRAGDLDVVRITLPAGDRALLNGLTIPVDGIVVDASLQARIGETTVGRALFEQGYTPLRVESGSGPDVVVVWASPGANVAEIRAGLASSDFFTGPLPHSLYASDYSHLQVLEETLFLDDSLITSEAFKIRAELRSSLASSDLTHRMNLMRRYLDLSDVRYEILNDKELRFIPDANAPRGLNYAAAMLQRWNPRANLLYDVDLPVLGASYNNFISLSTVAILEPSRAADIMSGSSTLGHELIHSWLRKAVPLSPLNMKIKPASSIDGYSSFTSDEILTQLYSARKDLRAYLRAGESGTVPPSYLLHFSAATAHDLAHANSEIAHAALSLLDSRASSELSASLIPGGRISQTLSLQDTSSQRIEINRNLLNSNALDVAFTVSLPSGPTSLTLTLADPTLAPAFDSLFSLDSPSSLELMTHPAFNQILEAIRAPLSLNAAFSSRVATTLEPFAQIPSLALLAPYSASQGLSYFKALDAQLSRASRVVMKEVRTLIPKGTFADPANAARYQTFLNKVDRGDMSVFAPVVDQGIDGELKPLPELALEQQVYQTGSDRRDVRFDYTLRTRDAVEAGTLNAHTAPVTRADTGVTLIRGDLSVEVAEDFRRRGLSTRMYDQLATDGFFEDIDYGLSELIDTNREVFNNRFIELTSQGISRELALEQAALFTPDGRMWSRQGFVPLHFENVGSQFSFPQVIWVRPADAQRVGDALGIEVPASLAAEVTDVQLAQNLIPTPCVIGGCALTTRLQESFVQKQFQTFEPLVEAQKLAQGDDMQINARVSANEQLFARGAYGNLYTPTGQIDGLVRYMALGFTGEQYDLRAIETFKRNVDYHLARFESARSRITAEGESNLATIRDAHRFPEEAEAAGYDYQKLERQGQYTPYLWFTHHGVAQWYPQLNALAPDAAVVPTLLQDIAFRPSHARHADDISGNAVGPLNGLLYGIVFDADHRMRSPAEIAAVKAYVLEQLDTLVAEHFPVAPAISPARQVLASQGSGGSFQIAPGIVVPTQNEQGQLLAVVQTSVGPVLSYGSEGIGLATLQASTPLSSLPGTLFAPLSVGDATPRLFYETLGLTGRAIDVGTHVREGVLLHFGQSAQGEYRAVVDANGQLFVASTQPFSFELMDTSSFSFAELAQGRSVYAAGTATFKDGRLVSLTPGSVAFENAPALTQQSVSLLPSAFARFGLEVTP